MKESAKRQLSIKTKLIKEEEEKENEDEQKKDDIEDDMSEDEDEFVKKEFSDQNVLENYWYLIDTESAFYKLWILMVFLTIMQQSIVSPVVESFIKPEIMSLLWNIEMGTDFVFIIDSTMQFLIPYYDDNQIMN